MDSISAVSNRKPEFLTKDIKPLRRGSLPFKKRRFSIPWSAITAGNEPQLFETSSKKEVLAFTRPPSKTDSASNDTRTSTGARGMAALAMAAAAVQPSLDASKEEAHTAASRTKLAEQSVSSFTDGLTDAAAQLQEFGQSSSLKTTTTKKTALVQVDSYQDGPAPDACHGRTSRNNAYCRRQSGYKGSEYCKLHYQHYILAGKSDADAVAISCEKGEATAESPSGSSSASKDQSEALIHHQDKRYTGSPSEIRCQATTTRGRECAYCAVNGKYCYLHADYDTNPPPRRGGSGTEGAAPGKRKESIQKGILAQAKEKSPAVSEKRKGTSTRRPTAKKLEKHMVDAPYPLLSTLATEKWHQRKVVISTGPLVSRVGHVEKWGNGWVSVRLPGVGLHNRRSFELYLHPEHNPEGKSSNDASSSSSSTVDVFDAARPSTLSPVTQASMVNLGDIHEVTPLSSCRMMSIGKQEGKPDVISETSAKSIVFPSCDAPKSPVPVPPSPIPAGKTVLAESQHSRQNQNRFKLSIKSPKKEFRMEDRPLSESLMLAQGSSASSHKLGLLFGTAALERSRRSVQKPTRFEVELPLAKTRKRKRKILEASHDATNENSLALVSSSSDEDSSDVPLSLISL